MWNFQRIICIWICCVSCMFGTTQLSSLVQAVPYEYFDDHEQSFYDLDSEQIQAKYDARLLTQQMLQTQQQQEQQLENLKNFYHADSGLVAKGSKPLDGGSSYMSTATTIQQLKSSEGHTSDMAAAAAGDGDDDDDNQKRHLVLGETSTKAAASTAAMAETLDELHLPRAASCFTNGQKFTHGQKVPRVDSCEVCLCMDGEIFCWWEKCDKKPAKASTTYDDYSTPFEESSTTRVQLKAKTTYGTTLGPASKPKTDEDYKYEDEASTEGRGIKREHGGLKEHEPEHLRTQSNQQKAKKKIFHQKQQQQQQEQEEGEKRSIKMKEQKKVKSRDEQQEKHKKVNEHFEQHHRAHNHNNNNNRNNNHSYGSNVSSSKILNFPENLPSVLYYDYKTEEHHQHQHQHREQHLKHQKQKQQQQQQMLLQQHENEIKNRQKQQQQEEEEEEQRQRQRQRQHHVNRHHEYGQDFNTYNRPSDKTTGGVEEDARTTGSSGVNGTIPHNAGDGSSTTLTYLNNGNENIYAADLQIDGDILPEPPTKKSTFFTSIADTKTTGKTTGMPTPPAYRWPTPPPLGATTKPSTASRTWPNTPASAPLLSKKHVLSTWDYNEGNSDKIHFGGNNDNGDISGNSNNNNNNNNNHNNDSAEDITDGQEEQDDAFHRWLTSTEINKSNFTLNEANSGRDSEGLDVASLSGGLVATNFDYNTEDRIYENIDMENDKGLATLKSKTMETMRPLKMTATPTTAINAYERLQLEGTAPGVEAQAEAEAEASYFYGIGKPKYERNFSDRSDNNNSRSEINKSSARGRSSNKIKSIKGSPFSGAAKINDNNVDMSMEVPTSGSNEDSAVASVVNIDIMLTASSADSQQQQQQPQSTNTDTTNQLRQFQQLDLEHEKRIPKAQLRRMQPPDLISSTSDAGNNNPLCSASSSNARNCTTNSNNNKNISSIVGGGRNMQERTQLKNVAANLSSINDNIKNNTNKNNSNDKIGSHISSSSGDSFSFNHLTSQTNVTAVAATTPATANTLSTTFNPERQCNVMGTLYKIGDVLPQDTGNCLQCVCIDGSTSDDTPRVTCSPHNCPPLVLPDLFDATGY